jgi:hypothetical protein
MLSISKDLDDKRIWVSFSEESASRKPPELKIAQISINFPPFQNPSTTAHTPQHEYSDAVNSHIPDA